LQDQTLSLFTMLEDADMSKQAREYLELKHDEELTKLQRCITGEKVQEAHKRVEAKRKAHERTTKVITSFAKHVAQPPSCP
jgi:hypothetical protein